MSTFGNYSRTKLQSQPWWKWFSSPSIKKCTVDYNYECVSARYRHLYVHFTFVLLNIKFASNFGIAIAEGLLNKFNYNSGQILKSSSPKF